MKNGPLDVWWSENAGVGAFRKRHALATLACVSSMFSSTIKLAIHFLIEYDYWTLIQP